MEVLNDSKVLPLSEIIVKLFNNSFLSDVTFNVELKEIRAHSFILMNRSTVYQQQFESNQGEQKLIPIQKFDYATFYQFVRFLYTDQCTITKENIIGLNELALTYNVKKLAELVVEHIEKVLTTQEKLRLYEFCVVNQHEELSGRIEMFVAKELNEILNSSYFLQTKSIVVEDILELEYVGTTSKPVKEIDILNAVLNWMDYQCTQNNVKLSERRMKFDNLIRLIRFPVIGSDDLKSAVERSNNLFTNSDILSFPNPPGHELWTSEPRKLYVDINDIEKTGKWFDGLNVENEGGVDRRGWGHGDGERRRWWRGRMGHGPPHGHGPPPPGLEHGPPPPGHEPWHRRRHRCGEGWPEGDPNRMHHRMGRRQ